jgi:hypothetical protein
MSLLRDPALEQLAEKLWLRAALGPQRLKPILRQASYRSGKPLRHPKSTPRFFREL